MLYLELIWIEDEHAVEQQAVRTGIDIQDVLLAAHRSISFGIGLRGKSGTAEFMAHSTRTGLSGCGQTCLFALRRKILLVWKNQSTLLF